MWTNLCSDLSPDCIPLPKSLLPLLGDSHRVTTYELYPPPKIVFTDFWEVAVPCMKFYPPPKIVLIEFWEMHIPLIVHIDLWEVHPTDLEFAQHFLSVVWAG